MKCLQCGKNFEAGVDDWMCQACEFESIPVPIVLLRYTQYLYDHGYLDDDWIMEKPSPILGFLNNELYKEK
jgi:hypothetical protein